MKGYKYFHKTKIGAYLPVAAYFISAYLLKHHPIESPDNFNI
jgi:hypothetical protein